MQLKLLNFHKMLANFSVSLVGGFIPLIVYKYSDSIFWAIFYIFAMSIVNLLFNVIFRKQFEKRPQLFLLLRAIPILIYSFAVIIIESNFYIGIVLVTIFYAMNLSFKCNSTEIILNYSVSQNAKSSSLGLTRVFEQIGNIIATVAGGLFLDYLNTYILIALAIGIYILSTIPLIIYYIRSKKEKNFNKEFTSNAILALAQNEDKSKDGKKVSKQIIFQYGLMYFLVGALDCFYDVYNVFLYVKTGQFAYVGYFIATYNFMYGVASLMVGYISRKIDTTIIASVCMFINAISVVVICFIDITWIQMLLFGIIGFAYPFYSLLLIERLLVKTRILGISNRALLARDDASVMGKLPVLAVGLCGIMLPTLIVMGSMILVGGILLPINEEKSRKKMIDYLEN